MENTTLRREKITQLIQASLVPISASALASKLGVSRQVIVGDVALLRAEGYDIIATARGYLTPATIKEGGYVRKIACQHPPELLEAELHLLVNLGVRIEDVIIEHEVYGELTGRLGIASCDDVEAFMRNLEKSQSKLLSELTMGIHLHTIICQDFDHFEKVKVVLAEAGYLWNAN